MRVLGVNALFHDPSTALLVDRRVVVGVDRRVVVGAEASTASVPTPVTLAGQADAAPVVAEGLAGPPRWLTTRGRP